MNLLFKATVSVILSNSSCKDWNVQFTSLPLQPLSHLNCESKIKSFSSLEKFSDLSYFKSKKFASHFRRKPANEIKQA